MKMRKKHSECNVQGRPYYLLVTKLLYGNIDQTIVNSLHGLLNCEIGALDCHAITTDYRTRIHCIHM